MNLEYGFKVYATIFVAMVPSAILRGYVLATLWRWFVVPLGMPEIGKAHAYGIAALLVLITFHYPIKDKDIAGGYQSREATSKERAAYVTQHLVVAFVPALWALVCGYIAHELMGMK